MKKIAFIDIDNTLLKGQIQQGFIYFLYKESKISFFAFGIIYVWFVLYKVGLFSDVKSILRFALSEFRGMSVENANLMATRFLGNYLPNHIYPGSFSFINSIKKEGYTVLLLSTAIDLLVSNLQPYFSADGFLATQLEIENGVYTGNLKGDVIYGKNKVFVLKKYAEIKNVNLSEALACADHKSDIPMLKIVGRPYLANPNKRMRQIAIKNNIGIIDLRHESF